MVEVMIPWTMSASRSSLSSEWKKSDKTERLQRRIIRRVKSYMTKALHHFRVISINPLSPSKIQVLSLSLQLPVA
jgi:hypothetical protein